MSQAELGGRLGIDGNTISRWERGRLGVSQQKLKPLAAALSTSVAFLMGETNYPTLPHSDLLGELTEGPRVVKKGTPLNVESNVVIPRYQDMVKINILPRDAQACNGAGIEWGEDTYEFESTWLIPAPDLARRYSTYKLIGIYTEGDSMEPDIADGDGDMVVFTPDERENIAAGRIMVVSYNGRMIVRGVIEGNKQVTLKAKNKDYDDITVTPDDDFLVCGRVLKVISMREPKPVI